MGTAGIDVSSGDRFVAFQPFDLTTPSTHTPGPALRGRVFFGICPSGHGHYSGRTAGGKNGHDPERRTTAGALRPAARSGRIRGPPRAPRADGPGRLPP